jgi:flavin-dependent dehydrogenase
MLNFLSSLVAAASVDYDVDVLVYGSSPAGIAAATAAGHLGMSVALYEPLKMIGGMGAAGNLALNDGGLEAERTGLARNFSLMNGLHYGLPGTQVPHPESFVAEATFHKMLAVAKVATVKLGCRLTSAAADQSKVTSVTLECEPRPVTAKVFIDASYDGEIMVALGGSVEYTAGREAI